MIVFEIDNELISDIQQKAAKKKKGKAGKQQDMEELKELEKKIKDETKSKLVFTLSYK